MLVDEELLDQLVEELQKIREARSVLRDALKPLKPRCRRDLSELHVVGIDGSFYIHGDDKIEVIVARAAAVEVQGGRLRLETLGPVVAVLPVAHTGRVTRETAEEMTAALEALISLKVAEEVEGGEALIVFDGPLVDPPYEPTASRAKSVLQRLLGVEYTEYHSWRARILSNIVKRVGSIAGYVKRVSSASSLHALKLLYGARAPSNVFSLLTILDAGEATRPLRAVTPPAYKSVDIGVVYWRQAVDKVVEIDVAPRGEWQRVLDTLACLTAGDKPPLPVLLAHEKSKVTREMAYSVYRLVARRLGERLKEVESEFHA